VVAGCELRLTTNLRPLRVDSPETVSTALLASLQPLEAKECVVVQWIITPVPPVAPVRRSTPNSAGGPRTLVEGRTTQVSDSDDLRAAKAKQASPLFYATVRLAVAAGRPSRRRQLLGRMTAAFHVANAPGVHLRRRRVSGLAVAERLSQRAIPLFDYRSVFNASELAALVAFPLGKPTLPGLHLGGSRHLAPSALMPRTGRVIAESVSAEVTRPMAVSVQDSLSHLHVIGPTGSGKSTLLLNLITQDMAAGYGLVAIDPKGDLIADVLDRVPASRVQDVIVLDPADDERPVGPL
jgi:hypothetical protein